MSENRILQSVEGVVLTEENAAAPGGLTAVSYVVSSARTPDTWRSADLDEATAEFQSEVKRSREANNSRANN